MIRLKSVVLLSCTLLVSAFCLAANARTSFNFAVVESGMMPSGEFIPAHMQCVRYNQWTGECRRSVIVPARYIETGYAPYYGPVYNFEFGERHRRHHQERCLLGSRC